MEDNFLARFANIFKGEPVPMAPSPSIVRAEEDEDIYVNTPGGGMPPAPVPSALPAVGPNPHVTPEMPPAPVPDVPPQLMEPGTIVPPETNETLLDEVGVPPITEDIPGSELMEAQRHYDRTEERIAQLESEGADPERLAKLRASNERLKARIDGGEFSDELTQDEQLYNDFRESQKTDHRKRMAEVMIRQDQKLRERGDLTGSNNLRKGMDEYSKDGHKKTKATGIEVPSSENQDVPLTEDEAVNIEEALDPKNNPAPPGQPAKVPTPDGKETSVSTEDAKRVAAEDPKGFAKAMGWVQKTFGITGQDLARFALLYAGSRIAGYGHGESMSWGFEVAAKDLLNRREVTSNMAGTGKYTPASIEAYRKTGDVGKLVPVTDPAKAIKLDYTNPSYKKGTNEIVHPATLPNGSKVFFDSDGKPYKGPVEDIGKTAQNQETRPDRVSRNEKIIKQRLEYQDKDNPWFVGSPTTEAEALQDRVDYWALEHGVSMNQGVTARVIDNAVKQAERWAKMTGGRVESLAPFIDAQMMYMSTDNKWAQQLQKGGEQLQPDDIAKLNDSILEFAMTDPRFDGSKVERGAMLNTFMEYAWQAYQSLPPERKAAHEKKDGFYSFLITEFGTTKEK